jgi:hypothetical protein
MLGFYYAAAGLLFGILCSYKAKNKLTYNEEWFIIGFIFNLPGYLILLLLLKAKGRQEKKIAPISLYSTTNFPNVNYEIPLSSKHYT